MLRVVDRGLIADQILEDLRERILSGVLERGAKLPTERELAKAYGVSGATVREALRALVAVHLIEVRHGSGAYVTANAEKLIAQSLQSMIQLERIGIQESLGILGVLTAYGAELAATRATPQEVDELRSALAKLERAALAEDLETGLRHFLVCLAAASHNALLVAICKFLADLQISMARRMTAGSLDAWRHTVDRLNEDRRNLVEAIASGDGESARVLSVTYHRHAAQVIDAVPVR